MFYFTTLQENAITFLLDLTNQAYSMWLKYFLIENLASLEHSLIKVKLRLNAPQPLFFITTLKV